MTHRRARPFVSFIRDITNRRNAFTALADPVSERMNFVSLDSFDEQPVRFIVLDGGYVVYNVAGNQPDRLRAHKPKLPRAAETAEIVDAEGSARRFVEMNGCAVGAASH